MTKIKAELQKETTSFRIHMMPTDISISHFTWTEQRKTFGSYTTNFGHIQTTHKNTFYANDISSAVINKTERCNV